MLSRTGTRDIIERAAYVFLIICLAISVFWKGGKSLEATWLLTLCAAVVTLSQWWKQPRANPPFVIWTAGICLVLWTTLSYAQSLTANYGFDEILRTASLVLIAFWLARKSAGADRGAESLVRAIVWITFAACLIGFAVYILQPVNRFVGPFFDHRFQTDYWPNAWADYVLLTWPLVAAWSFGHAMRLRWLPYVRIFFVAVPLACLALSYSRGAVIAFTGQAAVWASLYMWTRTSRPPVKKAIGYGTAMIAVVCCLFVGTNAIRSQFHPVESVVSKVSFTAAEGNSSVSERRQFWEQSLQLIPQRPLTGFGPYSFRFIQPPLQADVLATSDHPHNVFLKLALEQGIPAAVLWSVVVLGALGGAFFSLRRTTTERSVYVAPVLVALSGVLAHSLIDYNLQFVGVALPFWLFVGLLLATITKPVAILRIRLLLIAETILVVLLLAAAAREGYYLVLSSLGRRAEAAGDIATALEWYDQSAPQWFSRDLHLSRAGLALEVGDPKAAIAATDAYLVLNEYDGRAWKRLGDACTVDRDFVCALEAYEEAYRINRFNDLGVTRAYIELLQGIGQQGVVDEKRLEFESLLNDFGLAIRQNAHYIALSTSVEELQAFTDLFAGMYPAQAPQYRQLEIDVLEAANEARSQIEARPAGRLW